MKAAANRPKDKLDVEYNCGSSSRIGLLNDYDETNPKRQPIRQTTGIAEVGKARNVADIARHATV